jgi:threonine aldolase
MYLDGARIANAAAHLGCGLADIAGCADVLSFGGTKNGALGMEAVLVMSAGLGDGAQYHRKQLMQLASKMRFFAAQVDSLLANDLWLSTATRANAMAQRLAAAVADLPGVRLAYPVESNGVFTELRQEHATRLQQQRSFQAWSQSADGKSIVRWMTAFDTTEADVDNLAAVIADTAVSRETQLT